MKHPYKLSLIFAVALVAPALAQQGLQVDAGGGEAVAQASTPIYTLAPTSKLWFQGDSNVRGFRCEAEQLDGRVQTSDGAGAGSPAAVARSVQSAQLTVAVGKLECGNSTMNEHMWKALDAWENPGIHFQLQSHDVVPQGDATTVRMSGRLTIAGNTQPITLEGTVTQQGSRLRVAGSKPAGHDGVRASSPLR